MLKRSLPVLLLVVSVLAVNAPRAEDHAWLLGTWTLANAKEAEYLEFSADGVTLVSERGGRISGEYELADGTVKIVYKFKGKKIPVELNYTTSRDMLQGNLSKTGNSVQYTKSG